MFVKLYFLRNLSEWAVGGVSEERPGAASYQYLQAEFHLFKKMTEACSVTKRETGITMQGSKKTPFSRALLLQNTC